MAPEHWDPTLGPVDHRADIYSLGVVLYELLTGRQPFRTSSPGALSESNITGDPVPPRSLVASVPEELQRICLRCLARRPDDRPATAERLAADLRAYLGS